MDDDRTYRDEAESTLRADLERLHASHDALDVQLSNANLQLSAAREALEEILKYDWAGKDQYRDPGPAEIAQKVLTKETRSDGSDEVGGVPGYEGPEGQDSK